jgi:hypothetical protein
MGSGRIRAVTASALGGASSIHWEVSRRAGKNPAAIPVRWRLRCAPAASFGLCGPSLRRRQNSALVTVLEGASCAGAAGGKLEFSTTAAPGDSRKGGEDGKGRPLPCLPAGGPEPNAAQRTVGRYGFALHSMRTRGRSGWYARGGRERSGAEEGRDGAASSATPRRRASTMRRERRGWSG